MDNMLLSGDTGRRIYESISSLPICDIAPDTDLDEKYRNIGDLFLRGSYSCGELVLTHRDKNAIGRSDFENFRELCSVLERSVGCSVGTFVKDTLSRVFGVDLDVTRDNAGEIWKRTAERFGASGLSVRETYGMCGVELVDISAPDSIAFSDRIRKMDSYDELKAYISERTENNINNYGHILFIDRDYVFDRPDPYSTRLIFDKLKRSDTLTESETNKWRTQIRREMAACSKDFTTVILTDAQSETEKFISYLSDSRIGTETVIYPDSLPKDKCSDYLPYLCGYAEKHPICDFYGVLFGERGGAGEAVFLPARHDAFRRSLSSFFGFLCERGLCEEDRGMKTAHSISMATYEKYIILPKNRHKSQH